MSINFFLNNINNKEKINKYKVKENYYFILIKRKNKKKLINKEQKLVSYVLCDSSNFT